MQETQAFDYELKEVGKLNSVHYARNELLEAKDGKMP
jgi:hypothetical protein